LTPFKSLEFVINSLLKMAKSGIPPIVFKKQGSQDDEVVRGDELQRTFQFCRGKLPLVAAIICSIAQGASPFGLTIIVGDMVNVMTEQIMGAIIEVMVDLCL
jgi:hypothetical protein